MQADHRGQSALQVVGKSPRAGCADRRNFPFRFNAAMSIPSPKPVFKHRVRSAHKKEARGVI